MRLVHLVAMVFALLGLAKEVSAVSPQPSAAAVQDETGGAPALVPEESLKDQITLSIPADWAIHDQRRILTGQSGPLGTVLYSSASFVFSEPGGSEVVKETLRKTETGEIPVLQLDRIPGIRGATCTGITAAAQRKILQIVEQQDQMFSRSYTILERPRAEPLRLPKLSGLRIRGRSRHSAGVEMEIDLAVFADGETVYLLYARGTTLFIGRSSAVLERVLPTVALTRCSRPR